MVLRACRAPAMSSLLSSLGAAPAAILMKRLNSSDSNSCLGIGLCPLGGGPRIRQSDSDCAAVGDRA
eukprot:1694219-Pyramimonas_sp.AAC.1